MSTLDVFERLAIALDMVVVDARSAIATASAATSIEETRACLVALDQSVESIRAVTLDAYEAALHASIPPVARGGE